MVETGSGQLELEATAAEAWLLIPEREFAMSFRAYWPTGPIAPGGDGWRLPPVERVTERSAS